MNTTPPVEEESETGPIRVLLVDDHGAPKSTGRF
jgi:hypothetical protein